MKKTILALLICMGILFCCACAEDAQISAEVDWSEAVQVKSSGPDNQQLAEQYIYSISKKPARGIGFMVKRAASMSFDGTQSRIYALLKADVALVAAGTRSSTQFIYDAADAYEQTAFTPEDLGLGKFIENGAFTDEAIEAIGAKIAPDLDMVLDAIMRDCPYEMYWFDKTISIGVDYPGRVTTDGQTISFSGQLVLSMAVSEEFQLDQQPFECNPAFGATTQAVSTRAQNIVAEHAALADAAKLQAYKDDICAMTSYNYDAPGYTSYGNPWQLLWVFDDDPDTEVVCEGYAKAFQYLCNLSTFQDASVITVSGQMAGGTGAGDHMWNIAHMPDGWNYLVDITNCDSDSIGWPNELMLAAAASGDVANGYAFTANDEPVFYAYDQETRSLYSNGELAVRCIVASGTCGAQGNNLTWTLDSDGTLTISGSGEMADYYFTTVNGANITTAPWGGYAASMNSVVISTGVTSIGQYAFYGCSGLTSIVIPDGVTSIGISAFFRCSMTAMTIPDSVTSIARSAFRGCDKLVSISISQNVKSIGEYAFSYCSNLSSVSIPEGVTSIGMGVFEGCSSLNSIQIQDSVTYIGDNAFSGCQKLQSISILDGLNSISSTALNDCASVKLYANLGSKGAETLSKAGQCFRLPGSNFALRYLYTDEYNTGLEIVGTDKDVTSFIIPYGVTSIGEHAFYECRNLTSIDIPVSVTSIGYGAFSGCSQLGSITIPASVNNIAGWAFEYCNSLATVTIANQEVAINRYAFYKCTNLSDVHYNGRMAQLGTVISDSPLAVCLIGRSVVFHCSDGELYDFGKCGSNVSWMLETNGKLTISGTGDMADYSCNYSNGEYRLTTPWKNYINDSIREAIIQDGITSIGDYAFFCCRILDNVSIPSTVATIGQEAFDGCNNLTSITIPGSVTNIGENALQKTIKTIEVDCNSYAHTWAKDNGFSNMIEYPDLSYGYVSTNHQHVVPDAAIAPTCTETGLTEGSHCADCNDIVVKQVIAPALGHEWGEVVYTWSADNKCVTAARACARDGCGETETETAQYTFALAKAPTDTEMGETIYTATFENTTFDVEKTVADIPALQDMALLKLPAGLSTIEDEAFMGLACEGILIPDSCTSIGLKAFANCTRLVYVKIPASVENIAGNAFDDCPLVRIDAPE